MEYICANCGKRESVTTRKSKCDCGGLWKLDYTPPKFDLAEVDRDEWSQFRYRRFMALEGETWRGISLGEGMTPIVRLDENVLLKMDYFMPTLSFKDRGAAVVVAHAKAIGVDKVVQDSSGNAGNAVAAYCARAGIACEIFVKDGTSPKKIDMIRAVMEGVAFNFDVILKVFKSRMQIEELVTIGGGARTDAWLQILADVLNTTMVKPNYLEEATSMGAAITGGVGVGIFEDFNVISKFLRPEEKFTPNAENAAFYETRKPIFDDCYFALKDVFAKMR